MRCPARALKTSQSGPALGNVMAQQHEPRGRALEVELRQKGVEHLLRSERRVGAWKVGAIAPVLISAEEEHLDAKLTRLFGDREHVRLRQSSAD